MSKQLASGGSPLVSVVTKAGATARVQAAANDLAAKLSQITGGTFVVTTGSGDTGIAVGFGTDFSAPSWPFRGTYFDPTDPTRQEEYALRSHTAGIYVGGSTETAVEDAVWDLLYRMGYRQYTPSPNWEIIPSSPSLSVDVDITEGPDYLDRRIFYGYGTWSDNKPFSTQWMTRNRVQRGMAMYSGHAAAGIVSRNQAAFNAHPEYMALVNGVRTPVSGDGKFCNSNAGLQQLIANDTLGQFAAYPTAYCVSIEPSDGSGYCECPNCAALGSISDQQVTLANAVAAAVDVVYPGTRYVGMYAYALHAPPPNIQVHPRVAVNAATSFIPFGYTFDQILAGWQAKGATMGVRDYYSVNVWDRDQPGWAKAASTDVGASILKYYNNGAQFMSAESGENFGPCGMGYYLASRFLWDTTSNSATIVDEYLTKCFGAAKTPMKDFYNLIDGKNHPLISTDLIGKMYQKCQDGLNLTTDPKIRRRIHDLALYARYVELFEAHNSQQGFEDVMRFSYRIHPTFMVNSYALWRDLPYRESWVLPTNCAWNIPEPTNPWKSSVPYTDSEIDAFITNGIANNPLMPFTPVGFSHDLVSCAPLNLSSVTQGSYSLLRYANSIYVSATSAPPSQFNLVVRDNYIWQDTTLKLDLYTADDPSQPVSTVVIPANVSNYPVSLPTSYQGIHEIRADQGSSGYSILPAAPGQPFTFECSTTNSAFFYTAYYLYFYVPRGTTVVGGYAYGGAGASDQLRDSTGAVRMTFNEPGYWSVPVPPGQDGKLWKFHGATNKRLLMTVPPFLARSPEELLLPREVVEADNWGFDPVLFSHDLVPATPLNLPPVTLGSYSYLRYANSIFVSAASTPPSLFNLVVRDNYIWHNTTLKLDLYTAADPSQPVSTVVIPADVSNYPVSLPTSYQGIHEIRADQGSSGYSILPATTGQPFTFECSSTKSTVFYTAYYLYFYVPKGTTVVGGYSVGGAGSTDQLRDSTGAVRMTFIGPGYWHTSVPPGQDGKLWKFHGATCKRLLLTVPPFLARSGDELLLPREVVDADKP